MRSVPFIFFQWFFVAISALATRTVQNKIFGNSFGTPGVNATYDYLIIGGGTAGNTIAARLAENPKLRVAVVEAGGFYEVDSGNRSVVPGYCFSNQAPDVAPNPLTDWQYVTVPQPGLLGRSLRYPRGKTLGGSSALNYMGYQRATIGSFQAWADAVGDQSYTFDNILPYYQKSTDFTPPDDTKRFTNTTVTYESAAYNNSLGGPLQISYSNYAPAFATWAQLGLEAIGIPINSGFSFGRLLGSNWLPSTINPKNEHRSSSQTSFLDEAIQNTPLTVYTQALVKRILFTPNKKAEAIEVETAGITYYLTANTEIILSAGAFNSPQLLMVSGIGPKETLSSLNIPIISELPGVGQNMWDHVIWSTNYQVSLQTSSALANLSSPYTLAAEADYNINGTGPLTSTSPYLAWEIIPSSLSKNFTAITKQGLAKYPKDWPQIEYLVSDSMLHATTAVAESANWAGISNALITPFSRGNVTINSTNTADPPLINPNWLSHPSDLEMALTALKRLRTIWHTPELSKVTIGSEFSPGENVTSDADLEEYLRSTAATVYHASCTCKMGKKGDAMAVVDSGAKVFGVRGLRVVDISAFPLLTPGHPQATVYMLAEKIAAEILRGE